MAVIIDQSIILKLFENLNENGINYVLLRNSGYKIPSEHPSDKDIDILVRKSSQKKFHETMWRNNWKEIKHPWNFGNNFVFLYAMDRFEMYTKSNLNIDICYQLNCRSINCGEWMPLDQSINDSVWYNKKKNSVYPWYEMNIEDQLVHLITRCIFDKKNFSIGYISDIDMLYKKADIEILFNKLKCVYFKFTSILIESIESRKYENLVKRYIQFTGY